MSERLQNEVLSLNKKLQLYKKAEANLTNISPDSFGKSTGPRNYDLETPTDDILEQIKRPARLVVLYEQKDFPRKFQLSLEIVSNRARQVEQQLKIFAAIQTIKEGFRKGLIEKDQLDKAESIAEKHLSFLEPVPQKVESQTSIGQAEEEVVLPVALVDINNFNLKIGDSKNITFYGKYIRKIVEHLLKNPNKYISYREVSGMLKALGVKDPRAHIIIKDLKSRLRNNGIDPSILEIKKQKKGPSFVRFNASVKFIEAKKSQNIEEIPASANAENDGPEEKSTKYPTLKIDYQNGTLKIGNFSKIFRKKNNNISWEILKVLAENPGRQVSTLKLSEVITKLGGKETRPSQAIKKFRKEFNIHTGLSGLIIRTNSRRNTGYTLLANVEITQLNDETGEIVKRMINIEDLNDQPLDGVAENFIGYGPIQPDQEYEIDEDFLPELPEIEPSGGLFFSGAEEVPYQPTEKEVRSEFEDKVLNLLVEGLAKHSRLYIQNIERELVDESRIEETAWGYKVKPVAPSEILSKFNSALEKFLKEKKIKEPRGLWNDQDQKLYDTLSLLITTIGKGDVGYFRQQVRNKLYYAIKTDFPGFNFKKMLELTREEYKKFLGGDNV